MTAVSSPSVSLSTAPHGRGWLHYGGCVLLTAALFALLGPGVGALIFLVAPSLIGEVAEGAMTWDKAPGLVVDAVAGGFMLVYGHATLSAAFAGFWTAILSSFVNKPLKFYPVVAVLGAVAAQVSFISVSIPADVDDFFGLLYLLVGAISAIITAFLLHDLRLHPEGDSGIARSIRRDRLAKARAERLRLQRVEEAKAKEAR